MTAGQMLSKQASSGFGEAATVSSLLQEKKTKKKKCKLPRAGCNLCQELTWEGVMKLKMSTVFHVNVGSSEPLEASSDEDQIVKRQMVSARV